MKKAAKVQNLLTKGSLNRTSIEENPEQHFAEIACRKHVMIMTPISIWKDYVTF
jgi:hypothetical protein